MTASAALPLALALLLLAIVAGSIWYAVSRWPLPEITTPHLAAVLMTGLAGVLVLLWGMAARNDWTPPETATAVLAALLVPLGAILLAGGREDVAAKVASARAQGRAEAGHAIARAIRARAAAGVDVPLHALADEAERHGRGEPA